MVSGVREGQLGSVTWCVDQKNVMLGDMGWVWGFGGMFGTKVALGGPVLSLSKGLG